MSVARCAAAILVLAIAACGDERGRTYTDAPGPDAAPLSAVQAGPHTLSDLGRLQWLVGDWHGSGPGYPAFFERYTFVNDSTIETYHFSDETFTEVTDVTTVALRNGWIEHRYGDMLWNATTVEAGSIHFEPVLGAEHSFTWTQEGADAWLATMHMPDGQQPVYRLERRPR